MTNDERDRKQLDEQLASLKRVVTEADPEVRAREIAEYEKNTKDAAALTSTIKTTSTLEKVSDREIEAVMEAAMATSKDNGAMVMAPAYDDAVVAAVSLEGMGTAEYMATGAQRTA